MPFTFQLIVGSKQLHQRTSQRFLVDVWFKNAISNHGPNQHKSSCASLLAARAKCLNSHESSCASLLAGRAKYLSYESGCASLLAAGVKSFKSNKAHTITPSLSIKFVGESISEEAQFAPTIFKAFEFIVASTSIADFQLIVDLFLNPYREGFEFFRNISSNKIQRLILEHIFSTNKSDILAFQLIVEFNQQHQSTLQQDLADAWSFIATISIANLVIGHGILAGKYLAEYRDSLK
jgi:hypothetical protein